MTTSKLEQRRIELCKALDVHEDNEWDYLIDLASAYANLSDITGNLLNKGADRIEANLKKVSDAATRTLRDLAAIHLDKETSFFVDAEFYAEKISEEDQ